MFDKVLVANRGEIALRVIRACKEIGVKTVAVYSVADKDSFHVHCADEAICIGGASPDKSYLNLPAIISAAEVTGAKAIHPGYGFLSENAHFSEVCRACDIDFIGPTPEVIRMMGNKTEAKKVMQKSGVPLVPGSDGVVASYKEVEVCAKEVGYPLLIKASAGGGGRGMRVVEKKEDLKLAYELASAEAEHAFKDGSVYIEKFITCPRHVEIQILGDSFGNCIHLGERDCSLQRRHQKVLEEAPCPVLSDSLRQKMGDVAVNGAKKIGYVGAGTIEFLLDSSGQFYFIEMNTRVQVEHPITEMITGIDIVKEQVRVAAGYPLSVEQRDVQFKGCAIECRINAEDPFNDFSPSPGILEVFHLPGGSNVRVDTHCYQGYHVPPYYDSMIGKLIVWGKTRQEALFILKRCLDEMVIEGVHTTLPLFKELLESRSFLEGDCDTHFLEGFVEGWSNK